MNDKNPKKEPENRQSRFTWMPGDIEIIKNPDQVAKVKKGKPAASATPAISDPGAPEFKKDDERKDG